MAKLLIGFHHGIGDFIAFTPVLRYLHSLYHEIDLVCKADVYESGMLNGCSWLSQVFPVLEHPWGEEREARLQCNMIKYIEILRRNPQYEHQYYIPDTWYRRKTEEYVDYCCLPARGFDIHNTENWRLDLWADFSTNSRSYRDAELLKPYAFVHNQTPLWPDKNFSVESLPELENFSGTILNTAQYHFSTIQDAFIYLWQADRVILADSVFMWAAWALQKPIDYLHYTTPLDDIRAYPLLWHIPLIRRCNRNFSELQQSLI